jgi:hypothetical protein
MFAKTNRVLLMTSMLIGMGTACAAVKQTVSDADVAPIDPVFDCYTANSAWGLTFSGTAIDHHGDIWTYSERGKALPTSTQVEGVFHFKQTDLQGKYANAKKTGSVDAKTLAEKSALIEKASAGTITRTDAGVRDAGSSSCHAYVYEAATHRYLDVNLGSDGRVSDMRTNNSAPEAQDLLTWLKSVSVAN